MRTNEELARKYILHALYLQSIEKAEARRVVNFLSKEVLPVVEARLTDQLARFEAGTVTSRVQIDRLRATMEDLNAQVQVAMTRVQGQMLHRIKTIAEQEVEWNVKTLTKTIPLDVDIFVPAAQTVHHIVESQVIQGHKLQTWLKSYGTKTQARIFKQAKIGIIAGESLPEIGKRMRSTMNIARNQAEYLARTVVSATVHNVRNETFLQNSNILMGVQWVSTLDDRTTDICIGYDGNVYPVDDGPRPPVHFNCRSTIVPLVKSWEQFGFKNPSPSVRSSLTGYVPSTTQYVDWLNKAIGAKPGKGIKYPKPKPDPFAVKGLKVIDPGGKVT